MNVLMINGSPHREGCTYTALREVAGELEKHSVESEILQIGAGAVHGCIACGQCKKRDCPCVLGGDTCAEMVERIAAADGLVIGSPVYYAGPNGALLALLDRAFYSGAHRFAGKPGAAVVSCRRGGAGSAFDQLNKYFTISQMPVVPSQYWNAVHGNRPEEVRQDLEGLQIMRTLGKNMAWMLHSLRDNPIPETEARIGTNFIR